jgi:tRNA U34 5-methylaminomethyl-2-thiouridine-forming methyltransferase MnmC
MRLVSPPHRRPRPHPSDSVQFLFRASRFLCYVWSVQSSVGYRIVKLANGTHSVHSLAHRETFHPVIGPVAEAEALYVKQLRLSERMANHTGEFVIWDVGLGAAANVLTVLRETRGAACPLRIVSFDHTLAPLQFALENAASLGYFTDYELAVERLLADHHTSFVDANRRINWELHLGDFPSLLTHRLTRSATHPLPAPHAILFDAFSPAKNPAMWTQPLFAKLFGFLDPARSCAMPTYSRSTMLRVSLLLAGFHVGAGHATGEREETTIAANTLALISEPLDKKWLQRVRNSTSAEPMWEPAYRQAPLSPETWEKLQLHPQFQS